MSPSMCQQGLQSFPDSQIVDPKVTGFHLAPNKSHIAQPPLVCGDVTPLMLDTDSDTEEHEKSNNINNNKTKANPSNGDFGAWSFLEETLTKEAKAEEGKTLYVHPLAKRLSSTLSRTSLELCTENLGCETGSDIGDYSDLSYSSSSDSENGKSPTREIPKLVHFSRNKVNRQSFPPPLTSISNSDGLHFTPHREGGRLVIKAVTILPSQACFQAERGDGRLRLRFTSNYNSPNSETEDDEEDQDEDHDQDQDDEEQEEVVHEEREGYLNEEKDGNNGNVEGEMVNEKYQRHCRCKDGGHGKKSLLHWEPFLGVATT